MYNGSSPHTRGARRPGRPCRSRPRIIPAYAGSTNSSSHLLSFSGDHPRIRGEHLPPEPRKRALNGSSPHTRGAPLTSPTGSAPLRIIPAYAGSTPFVRSRLRGGWDHPRIRGEHDYAKRAPAGLRGSSPHTRGARSPSATPGTCSVDHPRIRGEHQACPSPPPRRRGSSPHTRGARRGPGPPRGLARIIPAYAGSTTSSPPPAAGPGDHPRIRGEHACLAASRVRPVGSSPHTRGAPFPGMGRDGGPSDHPRIRGEHLEG